LGRIKVAHIITRFDKGGSAENTYLTARGLDENRYAVTVVTGPSWESQMTETESEAVNRNLRELNGRHITVITMPELIRKISPLCDTISLVKLTALFKRERPHIVHTHTSKAGILGRWAAFLAGVPVIVHTPHGHVFWGYFTRMITEVFVILEKVTALITDKIITLTEQEKRDHLKARIASESKFTTIHSGVNIDRFFNVSADNTAMKKSLSIPENFFVVGTVGRLTAIKGHRYLIEAARRVVDFRRDTAFVLLGDGELLDDLKDMTAALGIKENVKFPGWRPDVAEVMSVFDIFLLPSLNEGMGRVLVEAMAMGKPVIASDAGGISDVVIHGKNGLLVPAADPVALSSEIQSLMNDPEKRKQMGHVGKRTAVRYSADSMVRKIDRLYVELLREKRLLAKQH
jgi:glycosyltransferase involved in cell wall biosynthesis